MPAIGPAQFLFLNMFWGAGQIFQKTGKKGKKNIFSFILEVNIVIFYIKLKGIR